MFEYELRLGMALVPRTSSLQRLYAMEKPLNRLPEHADNMSVALISSSFSPLILLREDLTIIAASKSFCLAFDVDCAGVIPSCAEADSDLGFPNGGKSDSMLFFIWRT